MKLYLIAKVTRLGGIILKKKDILAASDKEAMDRAAQSEDCPVCEVLKDGKQIGSIT